MYGLIFQKSETGVFLLKKILNETRNFAVDVFESGKVFYFYVQPNETTAFLFFRKVFVAGNGIYSKGVKSVDTRKKFPYN